MSQVWIVTKWWKPPNHQPLSHEQVMEDLDRVEQGLLRKHYDNGRWVTDSVWASKNAAYAYVDAEAQREPRVSIQANPWELNQ